MAPSDFPRVQEVSTTDFIQVKEVHFRLLKAIPFSSYISYRFQLELTSGECNIGIFFLRYLKNKNKNKNRNENDTT